jgi:glycosyltransferase involved in cell wall biosynthesis
LHILFFTDNFPPEVNAPASRTYEHCREWVKDGHRVTLITCAPNFPKGRVFDGYANKLWQSKEIDGIRVIRVWSFIARNEGFAKRILDYTSYMVTAFLAALFVRRVDLVVGTSPQFFTVCAAWACAALKHRPFVFELRDIWPESIRAVSALSNSRILDLLEKLELFLYRRAAAIISVTHSFKQNLIDRGIDGDKIHVVTNGVDTNRFRPMHKDSALVAHLHLQGKFIAGYIGTHGMAHALETLVDAAEILAGDVSCADIQILFLGDGARRRDLMVQAEEKQLSNILFLESVAKEEVPKYWSLLDVSIIHLRKSALFKTVIPSKMFECMAMGIPIIHGVQGESAQIITRTATGITAESENPDDLAAQIKTLYFDKEQHARLSGNGPSAARLFDRTELAAKMLKILQKMAQPE